MRIRLLSQQGTHERGTEHDVVTVVPHGGHYDCAEQYILSDGIHVPSDRSEKI